MPKIKTSKGGSEHVNMIRVTGNIFRLKCGTLRGRMRRRGGHEKRFSHKALLAHTACLMSRPNSPPFFSPWAVYAKVGKSRRGEEGGRKEDPGMNAKCKIVYERFFGMFQILHRITFHEIWMPPVYM